MLSQQIKPMEPKSFPHPFNSDRHAFQVKWDGVRILAFVDNGGVRLQNRKLRDRTGQYPEMQSIKKLISGRNAILDGEMIALENGRPSFSRVLKRDLLTDPRRISVSGVAVVYMVFDILYLNDRPLIKEQWSFRQETLAKTLVSSGEVIVTESFFNQGEAFYQAIIGKKLEGMVAKEVASPYRIGEKHPSWLKIKPRQDMILVIGGLLMEGGRVKSLLVGGYRDDALLYLGSVGSGLSGDDLTFLGKNLPDLAAKDSPFSPPFPRSKEIRWLRPILTVKIEFMEFTDNLQLRHPVVKGFTRSDPAECILP